MDLPEAAGASFFPFRARTGKGPGPSPSRSGTVPVPRRRTDMRKIVSDFRLLYGRLRRRAARWPGQAVIRPDNCVIFHTKIVSAEVPVCLPFCHDARYSQASFRGRAGSMLPQTPYRL